MGQPLFIYARNNISLKGRYFLAHERNDAVYEVVDEERSFGNAIKSIDIDFINGPLVENVFPSSRGNDQEATPEQIEEARRREFTAIVDLRPVKFQSSRSQEDKLCWQ